jgi:hypothetical protein
MVFCGNCGLQLAPGSTTCPRCRAYNNVQEIMEDPHANDATIASLRTNLSTSLPDQPASMYPTPPQFPSQQTALRPEGSPSHPGIPNTDMLTDRAGSQSWYNSAPGMVSPSISAGYSNTPPSNPIYSPYSPFPAQYESLEPQPPQGPKQPGRGRQILLLCILLIVLAALGITIVFAVKPDIIKNVIGNSITPTVVPTAFPTTAPTTLPPTKVPTTQPPSPVQQAQAALVQYYNDVNAQDYQDAWNLWGTTYQNSTSYSSFAAGYSNTVHDALTISSASQDADGTVTIYVTITATESTNSGNVTSIYQGTYTVGLENGSWKLQVGNLQKTN